MDATLRPLFNEQKISRKLAQIDGRPVAWKEIH
jgi:hypothetical protein